eukprot:scaffold27781_cov146-Isochrysis_galbana.AAC.2
MEHKVPTLRPALRVSTICRSPRRGGPGGRGGKPPPTCTIAATPTPTPTATTACTTPVSISAIRSPYIYTVYLRAVSTYASS